MIEREFIKQKKIEFQIEEFISQTLKNVGHSHTKLVRTPLGEKIIIFASRPGLVVGREGQNIHKLTEELKKRFNLEKPQIEINEVENINLDARIVAERIASSLERFGISRFKGVGHKVMSDVMAAGALGIEIIISGKVPSARAKSWRFYQGYLKKCGDVATEGVKQAYSSAQLKSGTVGIQVRIMPPETHLPDRIKMKETERPAEKKIEEGLQEQKTEIKKETEEGITEKKEEASAAAPKEKKTRKKKTENKEENQAEVSE